MNALLPSSPHDAGSLSRAQGCLLGQVAGDALGSLVEFQSPEQIRRTYPSGVRDLVVPSADALKAAIIAARTTRKYGLGWLIISQMLSTRWRPFWKRTGCAVKVV